MATDKKISYSDAIEEIEQIISDMENTQMSVDDLNANVKRASMLINNCMHKLKDTEDTVNELFKTFRQ